MQTGKRILAFLLALVLVVSCIPASSIPADAAVIEAPTMTDAEKIATHVNTELTYFHKDNLDTYKTWLETLNTDSETYAAAIERLSAGIAKLDNGYTFYDDGQLLGSYTAQYEPTYYAETVTYYTTVSAPSGKVITLHKADWDEYKDYSYTANEGAVTFHWGDNNVDLSHVKVEYSDSVGGARNEISNGSAITWASGDMVLFFTVTLNKDNDNKPEFLGAMVGDGNYSTDNTTDEARYPRQGMLIEYYDMAPYQLDQTDTEKDTNHDSAYMVLWGGLESTRGDVYNVDGYSYSDFGKDTPYPIILGSNQASGNTGLIINAWNMNSVDIYGYTTPTDKKNSHPQGNASNFGVNMISHASTRFSSQYGTTTYNAMSVNNLMVNTTNWITLADANTYTRYWGEDSDVAQIIASGDTISEFSVTALWRNWPAIIYDYVDANNYSYITVTGDSNSCIAMYKVVDGLVTNSTTPSGISRVSGSTAVDPSNITYETGYRSDTTLYYAGARYLCCMDDAHSIAPAQDMTFSWNSEKNCYDLTFENWPLVSTTPNTQIENSTDLTSDEYVVKGYAPLTVSLSSYTTSGSQLSNLYLGIGKGGVDKIRYSEYNLTPSATASLYGAVAVKTQGHDHHYVAYTGEANESLQATEKTCYSYAMYYGVCEICGKSSADEEEPATFEYELGDYADHTWSTEYKFDVEYHWLTCTVCADNGKETAGTLGAHNSENDGCCSVCGFSTLLEGAKANVEDTVYFLDEYLETYKSWQSRLESVREADDYAAAYNRVTNAIEKLEVGYTFVDDGTHVATYQTEASTPAETDKQTYYTTLTESDTLSFGGKIITLYQENFSETDMYPAEANAPTVGTAIYWANEAWTVEYSTDGGASKTALESGQNISISGSVILYVTIKADDTTKMRKFVGLSVDSDFTGQGDTATAFDVKVFRQQMKLTRGIHAPYKLDSTVDSSGSAYQVIWGGLEATRYYPTYGTGNDNFYDYPTAITFSDDAGISFHKLGGIRGTYVGTVGTGSDASTHTSNTNHQKNVLLICPTGWGQGLNNTNTETINNLLYKTNMLTLADKAGYEAYWGEGTGEQVQQVIPAGEVIQKFTVGVDGSQYTRILFNYVDANNYTALQFGGPKTNDPIQIVKMVDGVSTFTTILGFKPEAISDGENAGNYWGSARMLTQSGSGCENLEVSFAWNEDDGCYDLTFHNWPIIASGYTSNYNDGDAAGHEPIAYADRTVSLNSYSEYAKKLTNIYISGDAINAGSATITLNSLAVASVAPHVCAEGDKYDYNETQHWRLCAKCGNQVGEAVDHSYKEGTATYDHGNQCVCGAYDGQVKDKDFLPEILGSKILKANTATAQRLRIDVDFTDLNNAIAAGSTVSEYGVIVAPLASPVYDSESGDVKVDDLKALYNDANYKVSSTVQNDVVVSKRIMNISIKINADDYGKRIVLIAYAKVGGELHYSKNTNENIAGLEDGIISTGVMRVMKAILKDDGSTGYAYCYEKAATTYYAEYKDHFTDYANAAAIIDLINKYLNNEIKVNGDGYEDARNATMYVFHYSGMIYDRDGNAAPSDT